MVNQLRAGLGDVSIGIVFGLVVLVSYSLARISGAHINPAVTLAMMAGRRFSARDALPYIVSQLAGVVAASLVMRMILGPVGNLGATMPRHGAAGQAFGMDVLLAFILVLVILGVTARTQVNAGLIIVAAVRLDAVVGRPINGASMNTARSWWAPTWPTTGSIRRPLS